ncbi:MAG: chemotaxis protein CheW [Desulfovibrio sp.]|uniref:chemotaxis protein CheW n=1 Tax=Desulfovibrio sp. 7SRBS1 TaxID=3378064 RepID=UPI003B3E1821
MLYLIFQAGGDTFALGAASVVEVVPLVRLRNVPHAPYGVAGVFNYRGAIIPVVDLGALIVGTACSDFYSTRIIVTRVECKADPESPTPGKKTERLIGLIAEKATEITSLEESLFEPSALRVEQTPYLGDVVSGGSLEADDVASEWGKAEIIQRIDAAALLTPDIRRALDMADGLDSEEKAQQEQGV